MPIADPTLGETVPIVATAVLSELHVASVPILCVEESLNVATADSTARPPVGSDGGFRTTEIETTVAFVIVKGTETLSEPRVAVTFACPGAAPRASPLLLPIVKAAVLSEDQVTIRVRS